MRTSRREGAGWVGVLLGLLEVVEELARHLGEVSPGLRVVGLEEDLAQLRSAERVILEIELVEAAECGLVGVHRERVEVKVVRRRSHLLEHLARAADARSVRGVRGADGADGAAVPAAASSGFRGRP